MSIVPEARVARMQFYQTLAPVWAEHAPALGVPPEQAQRVVELARAARAAYEDALAARQAAEAATRAFNDAVRALHAGPGAGQDTIDLIRVTAQRTADPGVYVLARLPAPAGPSRPGSVPAPGTPERFRTRLLEDGSLRLTWSCRNPRRSQGTVYEVRRRVGTGVGVGNEDLALIGTAGTRAFTDAALPAGAASVTYEVTALRSTARGAPARFTVSFGTAPLAAPPDQDAPPGPRARLAA